MPDLSHIENEQFRQLLEQGHTPDEAAHILLQARRNIVDVCQKLLDDLDTQEGTDSLKKMLDELESEGAESDA